MSKRSTACRETVALERIGKCVWWLGTRPAQRAEKMFCRAPLPSHTSTVSRFGEHFRYGQYSLVNFLSAVLLLTVPPPGAIHF